MLAIMLQPHPPSLKLNNDEQLSCAGLFIFVPVYAICALDACTTRCLPLSWAAEHFLELLTGAVALAASLSVTLYLHSHRQSAVLSRHGVSGFCTYDFWMGRELHPRVWGIDLKEFCELYPGLTAWALLNLAFASRQIERTGQVRSHRHMCRVGCMA